MPCLIIRNAMVCRLQGSIHLEMYDMCLHTASFEDCDIERNCTFTYTF